VYFGLVVLYWILYMSLFISVLIWNHQLPLSQKNNYMESWSPTIHQEYGTMLYLANMKIKIDLVF